MFGGLSIKFNRVQVFFSNNITVMLEPYYSHVVVDKIKIRVDYSANNFSQARFVELSDVHLSTVFFMINESE